MSVGKLKRYGLPFANVVATGVATCSITPGRTIENFQLKLGGTTHTKAMHSLIKIKANGKVIREGTGTEFDKINAFRGVSTAAAYLDIPFADQTGLTEFDRMVGAFDTSLGIQSLTAEVQIAGATAPTLDGILIESSQQKNQAGEYAPYAGVIEKVIRYPYNVAVGGKLQVPLPFGPNVGAVIKRIHIASNGGLCTDCTVKQDGLVLHEATAAENNYELGRWKRVPQTNWYSIDFVLDGNVRKALDTRDARSLELIPTFSAADSGFVIVEFLDSLGNL